MRTPSKTVDREDLTRATDRVALPPSGVTDPESFTGGFMVRSRTDGRFWGQRLTGGRLTEGWTVAAFGSCYDDRAEAERMAAQLPDAEAVPYEATA